MTAKSNFTMVYIMISEKLEKLGLSKKEAQVYLVALEHRKVSASMISRLSDIKRSTAYTVAEDLVQKGVFEKDSSQYTTHYIVSSPESIEKYIHQQKQIIIRRQKTYNEILPELELIPKNKKSIIPRVQFIEGKEEIEKFLYNQNDTWVQSTLENKDTTHYGMSDATFAENPKYAKWVEWAWKTMPQEVKLKIFLNESDAVFDIEKKIKLERRETKFWNKEPLSAGQWVMGDYVINIITNKTPHHLIQIYDPTLAEGLRTMYRELWKLK